MANSFVTYTGTGSQTDFVLPFPYLAPTDIYVFVNGVAVPFTFLNASSLRLTAAPALGSEVIARRITKKDSEPVAFIDGSNLLARDLSTLALFALYVAQESAEIGTVTDAAISEVLAARSAISAAILEMQALLASAGPGMASVALFSATPDYPEGTLGRKAQQTLHVRDFGAVGADADETTALVTAMAAAVVAGSVLQFDGTKTYRIDAAAWTIPAGSRLQTNGCVFTTPTTSTSNAHWLTVATDVVADALLVSLPAGVRKDRCIGLTADDIRVGHLRLISTDQQATTEAADAGVRIVNGKRITVGLLEVENYDRAVLVGGTQACTLQTLLVKNYVRGAYFYDNTILRVNGGLITGASPAATNDPGHNGMLFGCTTADFAQRDVLITGVMVEDAGEHAWRLGGPFKQTNIRILHCGARRGGNCGLKILGTDSNDPNAINSAIVVDQFLVEDMGMSLSSATNRVGVLISFAQDVRVTGLVVRKKDNTYSCAYALSVNASTNVMIDDPLLLGAQFDAIYLNAEHGSNAGVSIRGGVGRGNGRHGVNAVTFAGLSTTGVDVDGFVSDTNTGLGLRISNSGTMSNCSFRMKTLANTGGMCSSNDATAHLQLSGAPGATPLSGIPARNGSWIDDTATLNLRKGGAWVAL